eukprot:9443195-Pyramimonas_sp.AAC.1
MHWRWFCVLKRWGHARWGPRPRSAAGVLQQRRFSVGCRRSPAPPAPPAPPALAPGLLLLRLHDKMRAS